MTLVMIALIASITYICIREKNIEIDNAENVSYIYLYEQDAEFDEAIKEENNSNVEGLY